MLSKLDGYLTAISRALLRKENHSIKPSARKKLKYSLTPNILNYQNLTYQYF